MRGNVCARAGLSVARDRTIDDARIHRIHRVISQPKPVHHTGTKLLNHDVSFLDQWHELLAHLGILEINRKTFFAAIEHGEIDAVCTELRSIGAHLIAASGTFNLDNFGTGFREYQSSERPRQQGTEIKDFNTGQRLLGIDVRHDYFFKKLRPINCR